MLFDVKFKNKPEIFTEEYSGLAEVKDMLEEEFQTNPDAWAFEERKFGNGKTGYSIKDKSNKIIIQIKQKV